MTKIEITDPKEIELYKAFLQHRQQLLNEEKQWAELKTFVKTLGYGTFSLTIKNGLPYRVDNPIQTVILGIKM